VTLAERQSAHRQSLEAKRIDAANVSERLGQISALILALTAIVGGIYLISIGKSTSGLVSILGTLASLAGVFIYGRRKQAEERKQKRAAFERQESDDRQLNLFGPD